MTHVHIQNMKYYMKWHCNEVLLLFLIFTFHEKFNLRITIFFNLFKTFLV